MRKLLIAGVAGTLLAGSAAMAGEPITLSDEQLDTATAGWAFRAAAGGGASYLGGAIGSRSAETRVSVGGGFGESVNETYYSNGTVESFALTTEASGYARSSARATSFNSRRPAPAEASSGVNWAGGIYIEAQSN